MSFIPSELLISISHSISISISISIIAKHQRISIIAKHQRISTSAHQRINISMITPRAWASTGRKSSQIRQGYTLEFSS
jgi:hypothetical protein